MGNELYPLQHSLGAAGKTLNYHYNYFCFWRCDPMQRWDLGIFMCLQHARWRHFFFSPLKWLEESKLQEKEDSNRQRCPRVEWASSWCRESSFSGSVHVTIYCDVERRDLWATERKGSSTWPSIRRTRTFTIHKPRPHLSLEWCGILTLYKVSLGDSWVWEPMMARVGQGDHYWLFQVWHDSITLHKPLLHKRRHCRDI